MGLPTWIMLCHWHVIPNKTTTSKKKSPWIGLPKTCHQHCRVRPNLGSRNCSIQSTRKLKRYFWKFCLRKSEVNEVIFFAICTLYDFDYLRINSVVPSLTNHLSRHETTLIFIRCFFSVKIPGVSLTFQERLALTFKSGNCQTNRHGIL